MPPLRVGVSGEYVLSLQQLLVAIGVLGGEPTGSFDTVTQRAVIEVQRRAGLPQTGVVDDRTWDALYQMQVSVAPGPDAYTPGPEEQPQPAGGGGVLLAGLLAAGAYWFANKDRFNQTSEYDEDEGDEGDEGDEDEDEDFEDEEPVAVGDYEDAVTDSLIEAPARMSHGGRAGDCKKAAMRLMRVQALVQKPAERELYDTVVQKVKRNCRGEEDAVKAAIEEEAERQEDLTDDLLDVVGQSPVREREKDSDTDENIKARKRAQRERLATRKFKWTAEDDGPTIDTTPHRGSSRKKLYESGFRKVKTKLTKKTTTEPEKERSGAGKGQGHRRGSSAVKVRRGGKQLFKMRKEKAKTKRGYTWRKEND